MRARSRLGVVVTAMLISGMLPWVGSAADDSGRFVDDDGSIFEADIEALAEAGLTKGCNPPVNDRFCPDDPVTRGEMASFLARLLELTDNGGGDIFTDDDTSVHQGNIDRIAAGGITFGCNPPDNDQFCPEADVTRGQMAAFLSRALLLSAGGSIQFVDDDASIFEGHIEALAAAGITLGCNPPDNDKYCPTEAITRGQMAAFIMRALRRDPLLVAARQPFEDDPNRNVETDLDRESFQEINKMSCPKVLDADGWFVEARTGGRPFVTIDTMSRVGQPWALEQCSTGGSSIPDSVIQAHYDTGKGVNRLWIGHAAEGGSYPTVVVVTADGFINISGAEAPMLAGGALRLGFIGEPFDPLLDYVSHIDEMDVAVIDEETLRLSYNVHSEVGEGRITVDVRWHEGSGTVSLETTARQVVRARVLVGFAGVDFMRGPTLHGIVADGSMDGIEAFHDGRNAFVVSEGSSLSRELLVPPLTPDAVDRGSLGSIASGTSIVVDQPQGVADYFSKTPGTPYEDRADLILELVGASGPPVVFERYQTAVDLEDTNPEANETVNLFFASEAYPGPVFEYSYTATVARDDYATRYGAHPHGVVYVSGGPGSERLMFQALDDQLGRSGDPFPLTDGVIVDPHSPHGSPDGHSVLFDADDYGAGTGLQRIYELDMTTAAVRRLTIDPYGHSDDRAPSLSGDGSLFAFVTNRSGNPEMLVIEDTATGLAAGTGDNVATAYAADWCSGMDLVAYSNADGLYILDVDSRASTTVVTATDIHRPAFSPDCESIAYEDSSGVWTVGVDGSGERLAVADGRAPAWIGANHLLVELGDAGERVVYVLDVVSGGTARVTPESSDAFDPTYIPAVM